MKLSFCITCKNRLHQIKKTLLKNILDNIEHKDKIEFVLVDFGSIDGLKDWVLENFKEHLLSGFLKYYYTEELKYWHACIAKNTSHFLACGDFLVNLDCDNYTGVGGGKFLLDLIDEDFNILTHQFSGNFGDGSYGRIGMPKNIFNKIGGYDESFLPMASQDSDIINRASKLIPLKIVHDFRYNHAEKNTKEEGLKYADTDIGYSEMLQINQSKEKYNIHNNIITVNGGLYGIREKITNYK